MPKNIINKVTLAYCDLGSKTMLAEEFKLRASIDRPVMPDNDQIMAYPYPYKMDRQVWTNVFVDSDNDQMTVTYSVTFSHSCLLWQHVRIYSLSSAEYDELTETLNKKYGAARVSTFDPSDHWQSFNMMQTWQFDTAETRHKRYSWQD